jgi:hypothetical protein
VNKDYIGAPANRRADVFFDRNFGMPKHGNNADSSHAGAVLIPGRRPLLSDASHRPRDARQSEFPDSY